MGIRNYQDLIAWQKAMDLVEKVYQLTKMFPKDELYGLTNQVRRASVSIPSNIAEGQGRRTDKEYANFLSIARGSLNEVETQFLIAERLHYVEKEAVQALFSLSAEVCRLIHGLMNVLKA
jgi:four helix bundle protein